MNKTYSAIYHHSVGLEKTHTGDNVGAIESFEKAATFAADNPILLGRIYRDWAFVLTRFPSAIGITNAGKMLEQALLWFGDDYPLETIYTLHYMALVFRAGGSYKNAEAFLREALLSFEAIVSEHPNLIVDIKKQQVYMELSMSSIYALHHNSWEARIHAWKAFWLAAEYDMYKHMGRACILWAFANWYTFPNPNVELAFYGHVWPASSLSH